jgi:hypothetical protein|nr:MAG TPA_asm: hypothetical protein [Caudoviricetes sp.]
MFNANSPSLADIAAVTGNRNNDSWGDGNGWWILIILFAIFGGWGNGGWGGYGANNGGGYVATAATQADIQRGFDNQAVISKLDGIANGLCDGFYAMNNGMLTGLNGINTNIMQTGFGIQQAINADTVAGMQNTNTIQATLNNMAAQNAACCCETQRQVERGFADTNYNLATQACQTRQAIADSTRSIIDYLCQEKISSLQAENNDLRRAASQDRQSALLTTAMSAQTQQIINAVNPTAIPAYVVPNPNAYAYGCNSGCGC